MEEYQETTGAVEPEPESVGTVVRLFREVIRTPAFVEVIKTNLGTFDEESARVLVRTLMNEDLELSVNVAATFPQIINYLAAAVAELGRQLDNLPEGVGDQYLEEFTLGIDSERFEEIVDTYLSLMQRTNFKRNAILMFGKTVNILAETINTTASRNPYFLRDALVDVDIKEMFRAFMAVAGSAFLCLTSWLFRPFIHPGRKS